MKQQLLNTYYKLLGALARRYIAKTKPIIVGINGSVGKTSCRMIVAQTLTQLLPQASIYTSPKNFNGELGMSFSIFEIEKYTPSIKGMLDALYKATKKLLTASGKGNGSKILILEYGIDHPGEMDFLISIAKPDYTIHTQIDSVHSLQFGNPDKIAKEEFLLEQHTRNTVFLNTDDPYLHHVLETIPCDIITYSASKRNTDTTISIAEDSEKGRKSDDNSIVQQATISFNQKKSVNLGINLLGSYHLAYAGVGLCLADILSYKLYKDAAFKDKDDIELKLSLQSGRWSVFEGIQKSIIIDSSYNASPRSMESIIVETLEWGKKVHPNYKSILVLGEMRELGSEEEKAHIELAKFLTDYSTPLFLLGNAMNTIMKDYFESNEQDKLKEIYYFKTYEALGKALKDYIIDHTDQPYIVLFKGSQNTIFLEEAVKYLLAHPEDEQKLTRQGERWAGKKQEFLTKALQQSQETL